MIVLDATTKSLEILLAGAVTTNQLPFVASYVDVTKIPYTPGENDGTTNSTTAVTVVAAPSANTQRQINFLQVYNADTVSATVTVRYNNNSTNRTIIKVILTIGSQLIYTDAEGWRVLDANGQVLTASAAIVGGSDTQVQFNDSGAFGADAGLTYNKTTDALTVAGQLIISGASAGQIVFPSTQNASANANTLDDYEEGNWTPVLGGAGGTNGQTYTLQIGRYVKVGKMVTCAFGVLLSNKGTITGYLVISGLPFATNSALEQGISWVGLWATMASSMVAMGGYADASATFFYVRGATAAATTLNALTTSDVANTTLLEGTFTYLADA